MTIEGAENQRQRMPTSAILCEECKFLLEEFGQAVHEVVTLTEKHFLAVIEDEPDPHRFDILIHAAIDRKSNAKYAYVKHRESRSCSQITRNETDSSGT